MEVDLMGEITAKLGGLADAIERDRNDRRRQAFTAEAQRFIRIHSTVILDSNGFGVLSFDNTGPDQGTYWFVRKLAVGGATPATVVAGRADVFASAMDYRRFTTLAECGMQDWYDQATALPLVGTYADGECELRMNEKLYVVVSGGTSTQEVHCVGTVKVMQESSAAQQVSV